VLCSNSQTFAGAGYPDCVASPFGSTMSGLGFVGCDLDIYLDLGLRQYRSASSGGASQLMDSVPVTMTEVQKVREAARLLR
jgi:hypothetical protein